MGAADAPVVRVVTMAETPPGRDELELTLFGPGYGESIVLHVGDGAWVIVDSCIDEGGAPRALRYLENLGLDPAEAVVLIVATHWHDDHIRGMAKLVEACDGAAFCCAGALRGEEFLSIVGALEGRPFSGAGSGVREIHGVFARLAEAASKPTFALANRRIFSRNGCEIWSLSPDDAAFWRFLKSVGGLLPDVGQTKTRVASLAPNEAAVALWIGIGDVSVLLGSDLEKPGWTSILKSGERPDGAASASAFKVPHHGSANADEQKVWERMLEPAPFAVLTPWRRGGRTLPGENDVRRILSHTGNAYATAKAGALESTPGRRQGPVDRTIRESGIPLRRLPMSPGWLRLRRPPGSRTSWTVETFGSACHLEKFAA